MFVKILFCDALSADAFQAKVTQCQQEPGNKNMITHHTPLFKIPGSTSHYLMQYKPFFIILLSGIISVDEDCHLFFIYYSIQTLLNLFLLTFPTMILILVSRLHVELLSIPQSQSEQYNVTQGQVSTLYFAF